MGDEKLQLRRVLLDVAFGPIAKRFCHSRKQQGMSGCASRGLAVFFATIMSTHTATKQKSTAVIEGLQTLLADSYALMAQTHLAHWNVEGPNFFQLHTAFQKQYEELFEAIDEIAERLRALDVLAPGGLKTLAKASRIEELAVEVTPAKDFVAHLVESHEILLQDALTLREAAGAANDLETQDLIIGRLQVHQKTVWMLKSFLKNL
jgi:starvation-inducible DNA-binding protein